MRRLSWILMVSILLLGPLAAAIARAGPELEESDPEAGGAVREAPEEVRLTFSEPLDQSSEVEVLDQCGRVVSGDTEVVVDEMSAELTKKPKGHYTVNWTATGLAGASGTNEGSFAFHVYQGDPCDPDRGGKGNHNHNNKGPNKNGNKHHGSNKHPGGHNNGSGGNHDGSSHTQDHTTSTHSSTDHSSDTHSPEHDGGSGDHKKGVGHGDHPKKEDGSRHNKHMGHRGKSGNGSGGEARSVAEGPTAAEENDALNLLLVLLLPVLLGTSGGAVLRARAA